MPRAYRAGRAAVRAPRKRISPCDRDRCSSARLGGRLLLQLPCGSRTPRCHVVHLAAKLQFLSFSTRLRPNTKRRTSANLPSCVSAAKFAERLPGAPADHISSRFDSLGIPPSSGRDTLTTATAGVSERGLNRLADERLVRRVVGGHWSLMPKLGALALGCEPAPVFAQRPHPLQKADPADRRQHRALRLHQPGSDQR